MKGEVVVSARPLYSQFAWAYDRIVEKPVNEWCQFIHAAIHRHGFPNDSRVLDAGCGTGEYALQLSAMGYRVDGIDISGDMIDQARRKCQQRGQDVRFTVKDLFAEGISESYSVVLCRGVLNDLISDSDRDMIFVRLAARLQRGGLLICDVRD